MTALFGFCGMSCIPKRASLNPAKVEDLDFEMMNNKILSGPQSATSAKLYHLPHLCELDYFTPKICNGHIDIG